MLGHALILKSYVKGTTERKRKQFVQFISFITQQQNH